MRVERDSVTFATQYYLKEAWADCAQPLSMSYTMAEARAMFDVRVAVGSEL